MTGFIKGSKFRSAYSARRLKLRIVLLKITPRRFSLEVPTPQGDWLEQKNSSDDFVSPEFLIEVNKSFK